MSAVAQIDCMGESLLLLAERAVYWPARNTLLIADWHLGKADVFGRHGIAIPDGDVAFDLSRLTAMIAEHDVQRVVVLGDLMHAPPSPADRWPLALSQWLQAHHQLQLLIVAGNHDRVQATDLPQGLGDRLTWHASSLDEGPFRLDHEPNDVPGCYVLAGHIHPTYWLRAGADRLRAPAFWFRDGYAVLPAFGTFTGGYNIKPSNGERVWVTGADAVMEVT